MLEKLTVDHVEQILRNALNTMGVLVGEGDSLDKKQRNLVPKYRYMKKLYHFSLDIGNILFYYMASSRCR